MRGSRGMVLDVPEEEENCDCGRSISTGGENRSRSRNVPKKQGTSDCLRVKCTAAVTTSSETVILRL
jgi:hypothetical protein